MDQALASSNDQDLALYWDSRWTRYPFWCRRLLRIIDAERQKRDLLDERQVVSDEHPIHSYVRVHNANVQQGKRC